MSKGTKEKAAYLRWVSRKAELYILDEPIAVSILLREITF